MLIPSLIPPLTRGDAEGRRDHPVRYDFLAGDLVCGI